MVESMIQVPVQLPGVPPTSYPVRIGAGLWKSLPGRLVRLARGRRIAVVADSRVARLWGRDLLKRLSNISPGAVLVEFPAGEKSKTRRTKEKIEDALLARGYGRDSLLVALGGGVTGDLAGFVAATFHRGVPYVQVPTTLLAMVDSSVGGKTAVDTPAGKNLIGAFWQPLCVLADPLLLSTLPRRELRSGLAEVAKHGAIADEKLFSFVEGNWERVLRGEPRAIVRCVRDSCRIKAGVVSRDEREGGYRQILNFGHTAAHALELLSGYRLLHGEALWAGLAVEARLAEGLGLLPAADAGRICALCERIFPVRGALARVGARALLRAMRSDKKARAGKTRYALPLRLGRMGAGGGAWTYAAGDGDFRRALERALDRPPHAAPSRGLESPKRQ